MHPRGMDFPKCSPRGIPKRYTQDVYTSWVTCIPLGYTSWDVVIPLGLHTSWVYLLGDTIPPLVQGVLPMYSTGSKGLQPLPPNTPGPSA